MVGSVELRGLWPIASGVLTELATRIVVSVPGWTLRRLRGSAEGSALKEVVADSVRLAFLDANGDAGGDDTDAWLGAVAQEWVPAFTPAVCSHLLAALGSGFGAGTGGEAFRVSALAALRDAGCDVAELGQVLDVEGFLFALPQRLYDGLRVASLAPDSPLRGTVGVLVQQRTAAAVGALAEEASPRTFREDLTALLATLVSEALSGGLPRFIPPGADMVRQAITVQVREGVRSGSARGVPAEGGLYELSADWASDERPIVDWQVLAQRENRVVVLADPGMGKSWLIRCETARLAREALDAIGSGARPDEVLIPLPMRCDEVAACPGSTLVAAAAHYVAQRYAVPERSHRRLREHIAGGNVILLLDALDELPDRQGRKQFDDLMGRWTADPKARFRLTSRIAGYTNTPAPPSTVIEVELQPFTPTDVSAVISSWGLPPELSSRLRERINDSAMANVARIPLLTALLCATASEDTELPVHQAGIYDRVLRRFLAQENRWPQAPEAESTDIDRLIGVLAPLAYHFATRLGGWADRMPGPQIMVVLRSLGAAFTELDRDAATILRELSVRAGVLVPAGAQRSGQNPPYLFFHRTIAEYLVAYHLASMPREEWLAVVDEHLWFDEAWRAVIYLLGATFVQQERPGEAVFLIRHLLDQTEDPFNNALFRAARVVTELPDHDLVPRDLLARMTKRMIRLLDCEADRTAVSDFLGSWLTRLPWQVTEALLIRLRTDQGDVTAQILANSRDPRVTSVLISRLDDTFDLARDPFSALRGQDADCFIDALLERFDNPKQRYRAAGALYGCAAPGIVPKMLERIKDSNPHVRYCALKVLGARDDERIVGGLYELIADPDEDVRISAVTALAVRNTPAATEVLRAQLDATDRVVRSVARKTVITAERIALTEILGYARHPDPEIRSQAAAALAAHPGSRPATQMLVELAANPERFVRTSAAAALSRHSGAAVTDVLLRLLNDEDCSRAAARSLCGHDSPEVARELLGRLTPDAEPDQLIAVATGLAGMTSPAAIDALLGYADHEDDGVRAVVVRALAGHADANVTASLLTCLADDSSYQVREAAATALQTRNHDPEVVTALLARLSDEIDYVREAATRALDVSDRYPEVIPALLARLSDSKMAVRDVAAWKLTNAPTPDVLLRICDQTEFPAGPGLILLFHAAEEVAYRFYRMLPSGDRPSVLHALTQLTAVATRPDMPTERQPANHTPESPDTGYLDTEFVIFLQGTNSYGDPIYIYLRVTGRKLERLFQLMRAGSDFKPSNYGEVLSAGQGKPLPEVDKKIRDEYNMQDVPMPIATDAPPRSVSRMLPFSPFLVDPGPDGMA